ncbi:hypothetical protein D9M71_710060 [compost metagenome]
MLEGQVHGQDAEPGCYDRGRRSQRKQHQQPRARHGHRMQRMPAFAIHPVEPFGTVVGFMHTPQPRHMVAEPVHGIKAEVQNHCCDEQLAP